MKTVTKDMIITDLLQVDRGLAAILMSHGMNCVGCPAAQGETLEEAAIGHGMDIDSLINEMNEFLAGQTA